MNVGSEFLDQKNYLHLLAIFAILALAKEHNTHILPR